MPVSESPWEWVIGAPGNEEYAISVKLAFDRSDEVRPTADVVDDRSSLPPGMGDCSTPDMLVESVVRL